jgi:hypothetical protein
VLNKRLFEGIGTDAGEIDAINAADIVDYYLRIAEAFPDEELYAYDLYSILFLMRRMRLYDLNTTEVFVDTPEMRDLLTKALQVPENGDFVRVTPGGINTVWSSPNFLEPSQNILIDLSMTGLMDVNYLFLDSHPLMQFHHRPVLFAAGDGNDVGFNGNQSFAILKNAKNGDLAWEFIRFAMETEDDFRYEWTFDERLDEYVFSGMKRFPGNIGYLLGMSNMPVNRARFENQVGGTLTYGYGVALNALGMRQHLSPDTSEQEHRRQSVAAALGYFRDAMERITYEIRVDSAVFTSLVYPDLWLLYSGQQDVAATLSRIQSRLELYVHE